MKIFILFLFISCYFVSILDAQATVCPAGFRLVNQNKCLKIFPNHKKHLEAEMDCTGFGGTLVTIKNAIDNRAVVNFAAASGAGYIWLGIFCFGNDTSTCYHDDSSGKLTYSSFAAGFPENDKSFGGCVYMGTNGKTAGQWMTGACEVTGLSYVCEVPTTLDDPTCLHSYNGYCYLPSHEMNSTYILKNTTFAEAEVICREYGSKLASVHSREEVDYIKTLYKGTKFNQIFLGGTLYLPNDFEWEDDTRMDYSYWDPIAPSNLDSTGKCMVMDVSDKVNSGMWTRADCEGNYDFLCRRTIGQPDLVKAREVSPKIKRVDVKDPADLPFFPDFSQCNTTLYLGPGSATSFGYPATSQSSFCTWKLAVLGPYRLGLYFTDFSVASEVYIYDEYGHMLGRPVGNQTPFQTLAPTNIVTMTHDSSNDKIGGYHGFEVFILPY